MSIGPARLNHAVLFVADLARADDSAPSDRLDLAAEVARLSGVGTAGRLTPGPVGDAAATQS